MSLRPQYGPEHRATRERLAPLVASGRARCAERVCWMPDRWIEPGSRWELAHDHRGDGNYLGPAHWYCNRKERSIRHLDDDQLIAMGLELDDDRREVEPSAVGFFSERDD